jgi:Flp pilus assembly protein TadD
MGVRRLSPLLALALAATPGAVLASGGGGGGGGALPSFSGPQYDPVQEYQQGLADYQAEKFKSAANHFRNVTDAQPKDANTWYMLGESYSGDGNLKGAEKAFVRSAKLDPKPVATHRDLAIIEAKLKENDKAKAELSDLTARQSACNDACPETADLKAAIAAVQQALGVVAPTAALPLHGDFSFAVLNTGDLAYTRAVSLINEHRYPEALAALDAAEKTFGPHPDILTYKGYVWRKLDRLDLAEGFYRAALSEAPDHRGATEYYGELKVLRGDITGARAMLAKLENACAFGCVEAQDLRRWIDHGGDPAA